VSAVLQELVSVQRNNTSLVRLGDVSEDDIHKREEHAVLVRMPGIFNDWDDVRALLGHVYKITTRPCRELDRIYQPLRTNYVGDVTDTGTTSSAKVENLCTWGDVNLIQTTQYTSSQFATERVPDAVLGLDFLPSFVGKTLY